MPSTPGLPPLPEQASRRRKEARRPEGVREHIPAGTAGRGERGVRLQLALFGGGRRHEPIAVSSIVATPPTTARAALSPSSGQPRLSTALCPAPPGSLSSPAPALTVTQTHFVHPSVTLQRQADRKGGPASQGAREGRQPRAFFAVFQATPLPLGGNWKASSAV